MNNERLDITKKETWLNSSPEEIASYFGYHPDENFSAALVEYKKNIVNKATITDYLGVLAIGFFSKWQPPLKKSSTKRY